jgi:hypothetical protein
MHFATSMALMLRSLDIPTRVAQGFLPGDRAANGIETVRNSSAHAWVEVYFPGFGWYPFDPTGGTSRSSAQGGQLPPGPSASPGASGSGTPRPSRSERAEPSFDEEPGGAIGGGSINRPGNPAVFIVITVLLLIVVGSLAAIAWWRGPRGEVTPDLAWHTVGRLAARFGFAPRPTQTVYEYAGTLSEVIPVARDDLQTVAKAKVEVVYGRSTLNKDRLRGLRDANRRLRVTLLRLLFRRRRRRGVRGIRNLRG